MKDGYRVPLRYRILRRVMKPLARGIFHLLANVRITGKENIPYGKPYVVATNHVSMFDPPFIAAFWPEWLEIIGASNVFDKPFEGTILKMYGVIPVHRGEYDRALLTKIVHILKSGLPLLIAPEGGRSHVTAMRRAKPGIAISSNRRACRSCRRGWLAQRKIFFNARFAAPNPFSKCTSENRSFCLRSKPKERSDTK
ncbi:MAG: lysophospholipid acyltransferase family protein [Anaerolineales bacterium]